mmetsp:Transcript_2812/g.6513  ORF Transcript_2812/g.6513 Transcript_2812/m.6513 type:complete len:129 (-) Transcript_2812:342-728(-)
MGRQKIIVEAAKSAQMRTIPSEPTEESPSRVSAPIIDKKAVEAAITALEHGGDGSADVRRCCVHWASVVRRTAPVSRILAALQGDVTVDACDRSGRQKKEKRKKKAASKLHSVACRRGGEDISRQRVY